jgi:hypothetical protein
MHLHFFSDERTHRMERVTNDSVWLAITFNLLQCRYHPFSVLVDSDAVANEEARVLGLLIDHGHMEVSAIDLVDQRPKMVASVANPMMQDDYFPGIWGRRFVE